MNAPKPVFKSLKRKLWLSRWSVGAPRMTIRNHLPWPLRAIFIAIVVGLGGAVAMWAYDAGRNFTGFGERPTASQFEALRGELQQVEKERDDYRATVNAAESRLNIEKAMQAQLAEQVRTLEAQNGKLKEDLAFFESLLPTATGSSGLSIRRLKAEMIDPTHLRYRMLLMQGGRGTQEFNGSYQLVVTLVQNDKSAMITFPKPESAGAYRLSFKHYQRVEGVLDVPPDAVVKSVQIKVLERGAVRAQQSENL